LSSSLSLSSLLQLLFPHPELHRAHRLELGLHGLAVAEEVVLHRLTRKEREREKETMLSFFFLALCFRRVRSIRAEAQTEIFFRLERERAESNSQFSLLPRFSLSHSVSLSLSVSLSPSIRHVILLLRFTAAARCPACRSGCGGKRTFRREQHRERDKTGLSVHLRSVGGRFSSRSPPFPTLCRVERANACSEGLS